MGVSQGQRGATGWVGTGCRRFDQATAVLHDQSSHFVQCALAASPQGHVFDLRMFTALMQREQVVVLACAAQIHDTRCTIGHCQMPGAAEKIFGLLQVGHIQCGAAQGADA